MHFRDRGTKGQPFSSCLSFYSVIHLFVSKLFVYLQRVSKEAQDIFAQILLSNHHLTKRKESNNQSTLGLAHRARTSTIVDWRLVVSLTGDVEEACAFLFVLKLVLALEIHLLII